MASVNHPTREYIEYPYTKGRYGRTNVRAGLDCRFMPDSDLERYFGQIFYNLDQDKTINVTDQYNVFEDPTTGHVNPTYSDDYFHISPFFLV